MKLTNIKNSIINFLVPIGSIRRKIIQYIYRMLKNKENRKMFSQKTKELGFFNGFKYSFYKLVVPESKEYQEEKYKNWIFNKSKIEETEKFKYNPLISIITPLYNTPKEYFVDYLRSLQEQTYTNWEVCLVDASSSQLEYVKNIQDKRLKYKRLDENRGISENSNQALQLASGEFIALVDHDDMLSPDALYKVVKKLNENPKTDFIYTDEDKFEGNIENRFYPFFKPDYSPDFLRSNNYVCHLSIIRKSLIEKIGGFRKEFDGAQDYDLILRVTENTDKIVHIPDILYHWRIHSASTAQNMETKMYAIEAGKKAIEEHCKRLGLPIKNVEPIQPLGLYKTEYNVIGQPLVSIIIPNKDSLKYLKRAIKSILKSTYKNYEIIIVENNSTKKSTFAYYEKIKSFAKIIKFEGEFNYS